MTARSRTTAELVDEVLTAWFGSEDGIDDGSDGGRTPEDDRDDLPRGRRWFGGGEALDARLRAGFGEAIGAAARGEHDAALADPRGALALVVLLDQFPRNVHRGSADAFAFGDHALAMATLSLARGHGAALPAVQRVFLALPFEHDETGVSQARATGLMEAIRDETEAARRPGDEASARIADFAAGALASAHEHAAIIGRFGRYPHRNAVLGRASSDAERAWLDGEAKRFGQ